MTGCQNTFSTDKQVKPREATYNIIIQSNTIQISSLVPLYTGTLRRRQTNKHTYMYKHYMCIPLWGFSCLSVLLDHIHSVVDD